VSEQGGTSGATAGAGVAGGGALWGFVWVAMAAASWGTWPLILRAAEARAPMDTALESAVTFAVVALVSGPLVLKDRLAARANLRAWVGVVWLGVGDALNVLFFFRAYQLTSVAIAVLTHYLAPVFVALAAPLVLRERFDRRSAVAALLSFAGLFLLLAPWRAEGRTTDLAGALLGATSAVFYASNVLTNKRLSTVFSGSEMTFYHGLVAVPLMALMVPRASWAGVDRHALGILLIGAIGPGALAGLLFVWGLRRVRASQASPLTLLEPLVAVILGATVFHETLAPTAMLGGALILFGAGLVVSANRAPTVAPPEVAERGG